MSDIDQNNKIELRITTLWALTEAALGGILHAFRIPFTGLIIGGAAIVYIGLLASLSTNKNSILKATTIVILIKFSVSPHTPLTAYLAVSLQGVLGYFLYTTIKTKLIPSLLLGVTALLLSASQRIIVVTIIFGKTFWESIDEFAQRIIAGLFSSHSQSPDFSASVVIIIIYMIMHLGGGLLFGLLGYKLPIWIENFNTDFDRSKLIDSKIRNLRKKDKKWYNKRIVKTILVFFIAAFILTYIFPVEGDNLFIDVIYMAIRAIVIISIWTLVLAPLVTKVLSKLLRKKEEVYKDTLRDVITLLPLFRHIVSYSWKETKKYKHPRRIKEFIMRVTAISLTIDLKQTD